MRNHKKIFDEIFKNKMPTKIYKKNILVNNCYKDISDNGKVN